MDANVQVPLFDDPLGLQLRLAREKHGLSQEEAAHQLRLPVAVVDAMEREDWGRLGARIYARSYVGSYLRLLGLPAERLSQVERAQPEAPRLVPMSSRSRLRHTVDVALRNGVYLVMTAVLVVPVWLVARHFQDRASVQELSLDAGLPEDGIEVAAESRFVPAPGTAAQVAPPTAAADPVRASLAPFTGAQDAAETAALVLRFSGESWLEVTGSDGERIERALVGAGAERRYEAGRVAHVTLGNADAVEVRHGSRRIDLAPFRAANVARFAVSSDGQPARAEH